MEKIHVKQVEGALDLESPQSITGQKTFTAPLVIDKQEESHHMVNHKGFIYWVLDTSNLYQEGNYRIGMVDGSLVSQQYENGRWITS